MLLPLDMIKEVLLRADIDIIKNFNLDKEFWYRKFVYHNFYFPVVYDGEYIELFEWLIELMDKTKIVIMLNKTETNLENLQTNGIITVRIEEINSNNLDDLLEGKFARDDDSWYYNNIEFHLIGNKYLVKLSKIDGKTVEVGYRSEKETERILCYCLTATGICHDDNDINFFSLEDKAFDEGNLIEMHYRRSDHGLIASRRYGMWKGYLLARFIK